MENQARSHDHRPSRPPVTVSTSRGLEDESVQSSLNSSHHRYTHPEKGSIDYSRVDPSSTTSQSVDRGGGQMIPLESQYYSSSQSVDRGGGQRTPLQRHFSSTPTLQPNHNNGNYNTRPQGEGDRSAYSEKYETSAPYNKHSSSIDGHLHRQQDEGTHHHHHHERTQKHKNKNKKKKRYSSGDDGLTMTSATTWTSADASGSEVTSPSRVTFFDEGQGQVPQHHHLVQQQRTQVPQAATKRPSLINRNVSARFQNMATAATSMSSQQQQSLIQMPEEKEALQVKWEDHEGTEDSEVPSSRKLRLLQHQPSFSREQIQELKTLLLPDLSSNIQKVKDANEEAEEKEEETEPNSSFRGAAYKVMLLQKAARAIYREDSDEKQDSFRHDPKHKDEGLRGLPHILDDQDDNAFTELSEDVFSFMYMSPTLSPAFFYGSLVFIFQVTILGLIMTDLVDLSSVNSLNIPAGVPTPVLTAQACALVIVVATQEDVITSLVTLLDGYHPGVMKIEPSARHWKFFFSNLCRLSGGFMYLVVSFFLIIQSTDILGLFLTLAALNFVSKLDDVAFSIAKHGFVSNRLEVLAIIIVDLPIPMARSLPNYVRRIFFLLLFCAFGIAWLVLVTQQRNGHFQCQSMSIEFSSAAPFILSTLSGTYLRTRGDSTFRPVYTQQSNETGSILSYCARDGGWTFGTPGSDGVYNHCLDMTATLPQDDTYDFSKIAESSRFVWLIGDPEREGSLNDTDVTLYHFAVTNVTFTNS
eukprot:scaffold121030_cov55-Attheya_sp.AAC.1